MLRERTQLSDLDRIRQEVMDEFEIVLTQMPYVGGAASRISASRVAPSARWRFASVGNRDVPEAK